MVVPTDPDFLCTIRINEQLTHMLEYHTTAKILFKNGDPFRLIHDDNSIRELIQTSAKDMSVEVFVDHKLDKDHPDYQKNLDLLSKLEDKENKGSSGVNADLSCVNADVNDDHATTEDSDDEATDDDQLSSDEEYQEARKKFKEYTKKMREVGDPDDVGGIDLTELQGEEEGNEQVVEEDEDEQVVEEEEARTKRKHPSNSDEDDVSTDNISKDHAESEYEDSDQLRSLDIDSDEEDEEEGEVQQPERLSRKKNIERPMIAFDPNTKRKDIEFFVGLMFSGPQEFREAIRGYCLGKEKDIKYIKNTGNFF